MWGMFGKQLENSVAGIDRLPQGRGRWKKKVGSNLCKKFSGTTMKCGLGETWV